MTTSQRIPGTILNSALRLRVGASADSNVFRLLNEWSYDEGNGAVHTKIKQGAASGSINDIGKNDIVVTLDPLFKREIGVMDDVYGDTTYNKMPIIGSFTGLPSWGPGATYMGPKEQERAAMADYLLRGVHFAGVADGNFWGGGDRPSPLQDGIPVDCLSMNTLYIPYKYEVQPMTPVKLSIDSSGPATRDSPARFTLEPVKATSIAAQMQRSAVSYAQALGTKTGGDLLMFMNVHKENNLRGSVIMRDDVEIGHKFILGQVGAFLHFFNTFTDHFEGGDKAAKDARKAELAAKVQDALFAAEKKDDAQMKKLSEFFTDFAEVKQVQVPDNVLMTNITNNGLNLVAQAVAEQAIRNNAVIGKIIAEKPVPQSNGVLKKLDAFLSI
jgi:hypothetical protein